ncbi:hypothetical protein ACODHD_10615 [Vagococcus fluvialis]|uniref:hypothetical protein n=1 Tax=Vagococcus fluvialis TaxID=2738 RepID=UPI003B58C02A
MKKTDYPPLQVVLANEESFRNYLYSIFIDELRKAKEDVGANKKVLNTTEASKALGISPTTLRDYTENYQMPHGSIGSRKFYDIDVCRKWITQQQID